VGWHATITELQSPASNMPPPSVLCLDLEGTLISNAVSQFPRPGLHRFLEECRTLFPRILVFTTVSEDVFRRVAGLLVREGEAPSWFAELEFVRWTGRTKDLRFLPGARIEDVVLVDDVAEYVHPGQERNWIALASYDPSVGADDELSRVLTALRTKVRSAESNAAPRLGAGAL